MAVEAWGEAAHSHYQALVPSSEFVPNAIHPSDIVLIGWPAGNEATRHYISMLDLPITMGGRNQRAIIDESGSEIGEASYENQDNHLVTTHDFGIVARVTHPLDPNYSILYVAGSETFGVKLAAEALSRQLLPKILELPRFTSWLWRHEHVPIVPTSSVRKVDFVAVVSGTVSGFDTAVPRVEAAWYREANSKGPWIKTNPERMQ